ncbi:hypothetical protein [Algoriphagus chordae]|uniref:Uncharacterized protein n=1 Tax=Algoriphagus chordae TaxID=237019 RepID=A0A2W7R3K0_9BACT|nr:hypothetical protein [Algoriphagus chordae]PZX48649.1 hypothetical protein LV85_03463 [Algoriphagus chordae]
MAFSGVVSDFRFYQTSLKGILAPTDKITRGKSIESKKNTFSKAGQDPRIFEGKWFFGFSLGVEFAYLDIPEGSLSFLKIDCLDMP